MCRTGDRLFLPLRGGCLLGCKLCGQVCLNLCLCLFCSHALCHIVLDGLSDNGSGCGLCGSRRRRLVC